MQTRVFGVMFTTSLLLLLVYAHSLVCCLLHHTQFTCARTLYIVFSTHTIMTFSPINNYSSCARTFVSYIVSSTTNNLPCLHTLTSGVVSSPPHTIMTYKPMNIHPQSQRLEDSDLQVERYDSLGIPNPNCTQHPQWLAAYTPPYSSGIFTW